MPHLHAVPRRRRLSADERDLLHSRSLSHHERIQEGLRAGFRFEEIQDLMRHASLLSTQVYVKVSTRRLEGDIARLRYGAL